MTYLLDRQTKRKRVLQVALSILIIAVLFFFRSSIFNIFSYVSGFIFRPALVAGNSIGNRLGSLAAYFASKSSLSTENADLKSQIAESAADRANYAVVQAENLRLKDILGRKSEHLNVKLAAILAKPNQVLYGTLLIDIGENDGVQGGERVFAHGSVPIGRVAEVGPYSSKVVLYSASGERTHVIIPHQLTADEAGEVFLEVIGRGGGNFEMVPPSNFVVENGDEAVLPGITPYVVGVVKTVISDPRDPVKKALLASPVNIQELKFVQVETNGI